MMCRYMCIDISVVSISIFIFLSPDSKSGRMLTTHISTMVTC